MPIFAPIMMSAALIADYLLVGGGGSAAASRHGFGDSGGGGGGRVLTGTASLSPMTYPVVVGAGGAGVLNAAGGATSVSGVSGAATTFNGLTAQGGEGGVADTRGGNCGDGVHTGASFGGGGGNAANGTSGSGSVGGQGGAGVSSSISGAAVTYGAGGGPGLYIITHTTGGAAGDSSGGAGATAAGVYGNNAAAYRGGGSGGNGNDNTPRSSGSGFGGTGTAIIRYPGTIPQAFGGIITRAGGNIIHTFQANDDFIPMAAPGVSGNDANCKLLLHFDGLVGSTLFPDFSASAHSTGVAGGAVVSGAGKFGNGRVNLNGTTQYLGAGGTLTDFQGTGDFTYEAWVATTTVSVDAGLLRTIFSTAGLTATDGAMNIAVDTGGHVTVWYRAAGGATSAVLTGALTINSGSFIHVAVTRASGTLRLFINGVADGSAAFASTVTCPAQLTIGADGGGAGRWAGAFDEVRVSNIARWTAAFTPPASAYT